MSAHPEQLGTKLKNYECKASPQEIIAHLKSLASNVQSSSFGLAVAPMSMPPSVGLEITQLIDKYLMPEVDKRIHSHEEVCQHIVIYEFQLGVADLIFELERKYDLTQEIKVGFTPPNQN